MADDHEMEFDEDRGGQRTPKNLVSFPKEGQFHKATRHALPWQDCGGHDQGRMVIPSAYVEGLFRQAPVPDPKSLHTEQFMVKCLGVKEYLSDALQELLNEGLLTDVPSLTTNDAGEDDGEEQAAQDARACI